MERALQTPPRRHRRKASPMRSSFSAPMVLPCLLQTEDHAQAITDATGVVRRGHSERFVSFRLARAQRLTDGTPLELTAVINEAALRLTSASQRCAKPNTGTCSSWQ